MVFVWYWNVFIFLGVNGDVNNVNEKNLYKLVEDDFFLRLIIFVVEND